MRKLPLFVVLPVLSGLVFLNGCALIIHGKTQSVPVASIPSGATVMVKGSKILCPQAVDGWCKLAETPGIVSVRRADHLTFRFQKDGYKPVEVALHRDVSGATFGNLILGGVIGLVVDFGTGAAYKQTPAQVSATLESLSKATPTAMVEHRQKGTILVVFREKTAGETTGEALRTE